MEKMISLILEDGRKANVRLIDYLQDQVDGRYYAIVGNRLNTSIKVYEVRDDKAIILKPEEIEPFKNYLSVPNFKLVNGDHIQKLYLTTVSKIVSSEEQQEETGVKPEQQSIIYYVFDHDVLRSYTADMDPTDHTLSNVKIISSWNQVKKEDIDLIIAEQHHEEAVYVVYDKMSDMDFFDGKIVLLHWSEIQPNKRVSSEELSEPEPVVESPQRDGVILYIFDKNIVRKYQGNLVSKENDKLQISGIKAIQTIDIEGTFKVEQFMNSSNFEEGAYFARLEDVSMGYKKEPGKATCEVTAVINHFLQKNTLEVTEEREGEISKPSLESEPIKEVKQEKVIIFEPIQRQNSKLYPISGVVCNLVSKDPFKVIPEHNGVRTISFEDPDTKAFKDTCQAYQNLYPNTPVYLVNGYSIVDGTEQTIDSQYLTSFAPQLQLSPGTDLTRGKRVLTPDEAAKKRQDELKMMKSKKGPKNGKKKRGIKLTKIESATPAYKKNIRLTKKEDPVKMEPSLPSNLLKPSRFEVPIVPMRMSQSYKKRYSIVNGVNDQILDNIVKMENLGHTNEEIVKELNLPYALVDQLSVDIPELKGLVSLPKPYKTK